MKTMALREQKGAALLTVLLLAATVAALAVVMTETMTRVLARTGAGEGRDQAYWALRGIERAALGQIQAAGDEFDTILPRLLAQPIIIPLGDTVGTVRIRDRSQCFNVNDLAVAGEGDEDSAADAGAIGRFADLVRALGGSASAGESLGTRIADFIDADQRAESAGAEDYDYERREVPYRTAGQPLASVSELRAISGFSQDIYRTLAPYLCTLPMDGPQALNVNTLTPADAPLLVAATGQALTLQAAERLIENRPPAGYVDVAAFLDRPELANLDLPGDLQSLLSTKATLIELDLTVDGPLGRQRQRTLVRTAAGLQVLERQEGEWLP
jgi:general secretion pathway protein K